MNAPEVVQAEISLRVCTTDDAETLAVIGAATLLDAFAGMLPGTALLAHCRRNHQPAVYRAMLAEPPARAWLAEVAPGAAPVGYALLTAPEFPAELLEPGDLELRRIYLLSRFHGAGVAQRLLAEARAYAKAQGAARLLLGVHQDNRRALAFYARQGFAEMGRRSFMVGAETFDDPVLALTLG